MLHFKNVIQFTTAYFFFLWGFTRVNGNEILHTNILNFSICMTPTSSIQHFIDFMYQKFNYSTYIFSQFDRHIFDKISQEQENVNCVRIIRKSPYQSVRLSPRYKISHFRYFEKPLISNKRNIPSQTPRIPISIQQILIRQPQL